MNKIFFSIITLFLLLSNISAQSQISDSTSVQVKYNQLIIPKEGTVKYKKKSYPCIEVHVEPQPKELKSEWRDYLKDKYDFKLKGIGLLSNKDVLSAEKISISDIPDKTMDFYTYINESSGGSVMKVFVVFGYDLYLSQEKTPEEYDTVKSIIENFLKIYLPKYYTNYIAAGTKEIQNIEKKCMNIDKSIESNKVRIEKLELDIKELTESLKEHKDMLENARVRLKSREERYKAIQGQLEEL